MKVRVWQINDDRDVHRVKFLCYDKAKEYAGEIDPSIYDKAWEGELKASDIERVYVILNTEPPADYSTYALSVSDVVEVVSSKDVASGYYFCDRIGFKRLDDDWREGTEIFGKSISTGCAM